MLAVDVDFRIISLFEKAIIIIMNFLASKHFWCHKLLKIICPLVRKDPISLRGVFFWDTLYYLINGTYIIIYNQ